MCGLLITPATWSVLLLCKIMSVNFCSCALVMKKLTKNFTGKIFPNLQCDTVKHLYFVGVNFCDFCEFDAIRENISMKILTLHTIACFYIIFMKFFQQNCQKQQFAKILTRKI